MSPHVVHASNEPMNEALATAPIGVIEATTDGEITAVNERAATLIETAPEAAVGEPLATGFPASAADHLSGILDDEPTPTAFEEYYPRIDRWLAVDVQVDDGLRLFVRETTEKHDLRQRAERLDRRLDRVQRIDALIVRVLQHVIGAADREEIARSVCERLGGADRYDFVWVGTREFNTDRLRVVDTAGTAPELRDRIDTALGETDSLPGQRAVDTGETQVIDAFADDASSPRGVRQAAFASGLQSCLAVPLEYQETVYGVVSVYAGQADGFSEQERAGLETLGRVAGFAIRSIRQEDLLVADTVTEVMLSVSGESIPLDRAAAETDTTFSLSGAVPRGDGPVICYVTPESDVVAVADDDDDDDDEGATDADPSADDTTDDDSTAATDVADEAPTTHTITQTLEASEQVTDVSWIRVGDDPLLQVTVAGETPVTALTGWGASITSATYRGGSTRIVAEAPPEESVRRLIETVDDVVDDTDLLAKEATTPSPEPVAAFRNELADRLTDRQQAALRAAYLADYFESPRGSTAAEVADSLDIAGPTLLYHLRRAQRKLVGAFLATDPATPAGSDQ
ncbi:bacterio-opsin activator domain-containing protein [Halonotius roseus]|uniref:GAF domain-containing protein n=1 Tax=Halonotius roseus TaxID=2511997 RepID=A0A544QQ17_9EURY|nr:bacterio-opsin activator domain-containing protein [Halonotius roseus]TQQ81542.1 GAF domain-containing protein [Halonotius roseus]